MDNAKKFAKSFAKGVKKISSNLACCAKKTIDNTMQNVVFLKESSTFIIIDGKNGNKLECINAIFENDYIFVKENDFYSNKSNVIKGNVFMKKQSCEMYEILHINKNQTHNFILKNKNKEYVVKCKKIEVRKITNLT